MDSAETRWLTLCEPVTITTTTAFYISTAMAVAGAAASYMQQASAASAQRAQNDQQAELNRRQVESANQSYQDGLAQVALRSRQEQEAASQKLQQAHTETIQAVSRERTAQGESGLSGMSLDNIIADFQKRESDYGTSVKANASATQQQLELEAKGLQSNANSRINSITPLKPVVGPSFLDAGLRIATGATDAYGKYLYKQPVVDPGSNLLTDYTPAQRRTYSDGNYVA